jgi:hypothetical protein
MADIKVQDLSTHNISGIDLFNDSEDFMLELSAENEVSILGGLKCPGGETCYYMTKWWENTPRPLRS